MLLHYIHQEQYCGRSCRVGYKQRGDTECGYVYPIESLDVELPASGDQPATLNDQPATLNDQPDPLNDQPHPNQISNTWK